MSRLVYMQDKLPPNTSEFMKRLAKILMDRKEYWHWARRPLEEIWSECDDGYLCYRQLPISEGMPWIDQSDFGPTDLFDGTNQLAYTLALAIMPKDESWLTMESYPNEDPGIVKQLQAHQIWLHRKAQTRRVFSRHLKQLIVRGTSSIFWQWSREERYTRLSGIDSIIALAKELGISKEEAAQYGRARQMDVRHDGPRIRPLDVFDLFNDPEADVVLDRRTANIVQTFRRLSDLEAEYDEQNQRVYAEKDIKDIVPWTAEDIYHKDEDGQKRLQSLNTMGVYPQNAVDRSTKLVPVYVFYCPFLEHEGKKFYDTYFHVALSRTGNSPFMVRVEENPSDHGHNFVLTDTYIDWFTNVAYGISGIEKQLSAYKQLGVIEAILLQSMVAAQYPAMMMQDGLMKENEGFNGAPGAINIIAGGAMNENSLRPVPTPDHGVQLGLQDNRWYKQKVAEGFGNLGSYQDDPTRSMSSRETATSVNFRATTGSRSVDDQSEKFGDTLQELCQGVSDMSKQMTLPDGNGKVNYSRITGQPRQVLRESLNYADFIKEREVQVLGLHGVVNRAQEIQELRDALEVVGMTAQALPNAPVMTQAIALQLIQKLQVEIPPGAEMTPEQLAAANPQVQMMALQQVLPAAAAALQQVQGKQKPGGMTSGGGMQNSPTGRNKPLQTAAPAQPEPPTA